MKMIKKFLSLFLVLACVITLLPMNVFAQSGGGDSASGSGSASPTGTGIMFRGVAYRIRLIDESAGFDSGNMKTITVDRANKKVTLKENNASNLGNASGSDWWYFTGVACGNAYCVEAGSYQALNMDGSISSVTVHPKSDLEKYIGAFSSVDDLIKQDGNISKYCDENLESWKKFFNYNSNNPCLLVIEVLYNMTDTYKSNKTLVSRQQLYYAGSTNSRICYESDLVANVYGVNCPDTTNHGGKILKNYIYQTAAPYGYTLNTVGEKANGYIVYGLEHIVASKTTSANLVVEYQGEQGTNDSSKYNLSATIVEGDITASTSAYSSIGYLSSSGFSSSSSMDSYLGLSSGFKSDSAYSIAYTGVTTLKVNADTSLENIKKALNGIDTSKLSINWGETPVVAGTNGKAVGSMYSVNGISFNGSTYVNGVTNIANAVKDKVGTGTTVGSVTSYKNSISGVALKNAINYVLGKATNTSADNNTTSSNNLKKSSNMGLGITFIVKSSTVQSKLCTITIGDEVNVSWGNDISYGTASSYAFGLDTSASAYVVVPYDKAVTVDATIKNTLKGNYDTESIISELNSLCSDAMVLSGTEIPASITCGTDNGKGFVIYQVILDEETEEGNIELPAYLLNKYFDNVIQTSSDNVGVKNVFKLNKYQYAAYDKISSTCKVNSTNYVTGYSSNYNVCYKDCTVFANDSGDNLGRYLLKATGTWDGAVRNTLTGNYTTVVDTENTSSYVVDYAFNFVRSGVGDIRTISGIHYGNLATIDKDNILMCDFGVSPKTIIEASAVATPNAVISGNHKVNILIKARFEQTNSTVAENISSIIAHNAHSSGNSSCSGFKYFTFKNEDLYAFVMNSTKKNTLDYTFTRTAYKYQTAELGVGKNTNLIDGVLALDLYSNKASLDGNTVKADEAYKFAYVESNGRNLAFYPEVKMAYRLLTGNTYESGSYKTVYTMGEEKRVAESSTLFLYKINSGSIKAVKGTTVSDTMSKYGNMVSIPAGSGVTVQADVNGLSLDLYGYALDIIDKNKDSVMQIGASSTVVYKDIVTSGEDVYGAWNSTKNSDVLKSKFTTWVGKMLDSENYKANLVMNVTNSNTSFYNDSSATNTTFNMNASLGSFVKGSEVTENGVYPIEIEHGVINTSASGYKGLISQISSDYGVSYEEAEELFKASGVYTAILNAIESDSDSFNKSGATANSNWSLGNDSNWYDESTRTFVVRRYTCLNNKFGSIVAQDKIDYNLAATSINANRYGNFYLDIYFAKDMLGLGTSNLFDSSRGVGFANNTLTKAIDGHTMLIHNIYVDGATFTIPVKSSNGF